MKQIFKIAAAGVLALFISSASAKLVVPSADDLPELFPEARHDLACSRIFNYFTRAHYKIVSVDDNFSVKVIDRLLSFLDYGKSLYTQAEINDVYANRAQIKKALTSCDLSYPYALYNSSIKKRYEKYSFFVEATKREINTGGNDQIELDRSKDSAYAKDDQALRKIWHEEFKNEYINQILNGKSDQEAKERIRRRYNAALIRLSQTQSEDAFSTFENAFATAIDPHTNYFSPVDSENFNDDINLSLEGIGAVLSQEDEYTVIQSLLPGSPAEKSKMLKPKDKIVGVHQEDGSYDDIIGWRLTDVVKKIKGPKGSKVTLDIERGDSAKAFSVKIVRDKIRLQDREAKGKVYDSYLGDKVGVITVSSFYTDLHKDISRELLKLKDQHVKAVVVDLRNNGGGLLPEAVMSTGLFIKKGPVVLVRDVNGIEAPYDDSDETMDYSGPLVVLINRLSASSSEIMSAALQDYGRALIVGDNSFGKGTVQQSRPLARLYDLNGEEMGSIHYTIAKFYRINGDSTQIKGVEPDIALPTLVDVTELGEGSEPNALPWDKIKPAVYDKYLNLGVYLPKLKALHQNRVKDNVEFKIFRDEMRRYLKLKEERYLTLNLEKRREIHDEDERHALNNVNARLKIMGKEEVKNIDDLPEGFEFDDPILQESVDIASDFGRMLGSSAIEPANAPIFMRYQPKAVNE